MSKISLWPEEITQEVGLDGPAAILKEQASQLGKQTKNLVTAQISSAMQEEQFIDRFVVEGKIINYRYHLFSVSYPIDFYPAIIHADLPGLGGLAVQDEDEFLKVLERIFSNPKTIKVIQAIITRSKQEKPDDDFEDS